jgi:hypothetical protein
MELIFTNSTMGKSESTMTTDGIKITLVHRTKSNVIVYYGDKLIAECKNKQDALDALSTFMQPVV